MKKQILSLTILVTSLCFLVSPSQAQTRPSFGIRGGVNFANLNDTNSDASLDARTGFMAGLYANFLIPNSPVSIQPEVLYTQKGAKINGTDSQLKYKLDYIEIPVLFKFSYITDGAVTPNVYVGPYLGFNVNAEAKASGGNGSATVDGSDNVKDTDFGVTVGADIDFDRFNIGVRYDAGLTKVFDGDTDAKNGVLAIVAGIGF